MEEISYKYDPLGRRIEKRNSKGTKHFVWDGNTIVHEYATQDASDEQEDLVTWVFDGGFTPLSKITSKDSYSIVSDYLGTPVEAYNSKGKLIWSCELDIYGRVKDFTEIKTIGGYACDEEYSVDFIPHRYQGQLHDIDSELYYNRFRYFDPKIGMYTQLDPIGLAGGNPTLYGYVSDPNSQVDVFGLRCGRPDGYRTNDIDRHGNLSPGKNRAPGHGNIPSDGRVQSHHIIQDSWAQKRVPGYKRNDAPAILLQTGTGKPHTSISNAQRARRSSGGYNTTIRQEFNASFRELLDAGIDAKTAKKAIREAYKYFDGLGAF